MTLEHQRLIAQAVAALKLPMPVNPEPEDVSAAIRRQRATAKSVLTDADTYRLAQARFIMRKTATYYETRHEEPDLVCRLKDGLVLDEWPMMN